MASSAQPRLATKHHIDFQDLFRKRIRNAAAKSAAPSEPALSRATLRDASPHEGRGAIINKTPFHNMNSFKHYIKNLYRFHLKRYMQIVAVVTFVGAYNLFKATPFGAPKLIFAVLGEDEFQDQVISGVRDLGTKMRRVEQDYDSLDRKTKQAFEDLTKVKNNLNSIEEFGRKLRKVELMLSHERRWAYGSPIQRIQQDEELRTRFNAAIRLAVNNTDQDMTKTVAPMLRALGEDSSPGSTLINDALANEIYDTLASYGIWNTFAVRPVGTKTTKFAVKTARPVANYILTEGSGQIPDDTNKAGTTVPAEVEVIAVLLNVSLQLLQDAEIDVTADVMEDFAEALSLRLDHSCLTADGDEDATDGGMTGIFSGGTAASAVSGNVSVETTDLEDWTNCLLTVDSAVLKRPARWWMHPQILVRALSVKDGNGRPMFLTATEAPTAGGIGSILGYPVTLAHAAPSANTTSSTVAAFGDPNGQVVAISKNFTFEASDHHKWDYLQRSFRGYGRAANVLRRSTAFSVLTLASG